MAGITERCPLRNLLGQLPELQVDARGQLDFLASSPSLLLSIAESAEAAVASVSLGLSAVGVLLARPRPATEEGLEGADIMQALGWLLADLAAVVAACQLMSVQCRRANGASQ